MTGFLRRLAARANGTAQRLRLNAQLPYGQAPGFSENGGRAANGPEHQAPGPSEVVASEEWAETARTPSVPMRPAPRGPAANGPEWQAPDPSKVGQAPDPSKVVASEEWVETARTPSVHTRPAPILPPVGRLISPARAEHRKRERMGPQSREGPIAGDPVAAKAAVDEGVQFEAGRSLPTRALSAPTLLPPQRPTVLDGSGAVAPALRSTEQATEVHVSIGRIEVAALHEAPAPKRQRVRAESPMSLRDYLDKRRRGRP
jgi:hypothetical protein